MKKRRGRGEGAVFYSRSKAAWVGTLPGSRRQVTAKTKQALLAKLERAKARGGEGPSRLTLADYLDDWLALARARIEPATWDNYEVSVRVHLKPALGGLRLREVTAERVERWLADAQAAGLSGGTAKKLRQHLHTALRAAARRGLVARAETAHTPAPRPAFREVQPFTPDEVKRILAAARGRQYSALFCLALATGARLSELLALDWERVAPDCSSVRFERSLQSGTGGGYKATKTRRGRRQVSLPRFAQEELLALRGEQKVMSTPEQKVPFGPLFLTSRGAQLERRSARRRWEVLLKRAGVPYRKFHSARHTHASQLLAAGVSLVEVARRLGDDPRTILAVYSHYMPSDADVPGKLDALYG